jgi:replication-associated recombination protein RarA
MEVPITESGYNVSHLISALHKDIRRSVEEQAMFWAICLERYNCRTLWNMLEAIASEDIGLADPMMPVKIHALREQYFDAVVSQQESYRLFLANAVLQLCRSPKSRVVDDFVWDIYWRYYK